MLRTSNPALSDKVWARAVPADQLQDGWGAPTQVPPGPDGASPWTPSRPYATMTVGGSVSATAVLLVVLITFGVFGWNSVEIPRNELVGPTLPGWLLFAVFGALGIAILTTFKPHLARFTAPVYAAVQGLAVGAISALYQFLYEGIVIQAVGLTVGITGVMLALYGLRIIKVTDKFRMCVVAATGAIFLLYMINLGLGLFGVDLPFLHESTPIGIGISLVIVGIAALNLALDFDFIEKGSQAGAPKHMEWYAAFGLLVTLVWLYLELIRLLSKLQSR
jgi:uncharacterized YccA/Bax inhibitor family protein